MVRITETKVEHFHGHARGWVCMLMRAAVTTLVALALAGLGDTLGVLLPPDQKCIDFPQFLRNFDKKRILSTPYPGPG